MTNILTAAEAANALRTDISDPAMLDLLPSVDAYIRNATGRDWASDADPHPTAKAAARILLVMSYDNPAMLSNGQGSLPQGLTAVLSQLEALALCYKTFPGRNGAGAISLLGAEVGDTVASLMGLIGATGDQRADFETWISVNGQIQQTATGDLSANYYRVHLVPLSAL